jgi:hypothetical protein
MIHIPIEQRYDKSRQMFHSGAWVAAGTIISVGAAAAGTAMSTSAANKAAAATGAAGKKMDQRMQEAQQRLVGQLGQIQAPQWNIARDIKDAGKITDYNLAELEQIFPGAKTSREIAGQTAIAYQKGEIPKDMRDSIMRSVAELGGAGFAPQQAGQVGGFQAAQGLLSRQLGLQSVQLSQLGNQISQSWQAIAGSFIESPLQVGQARLGYEKAAADIQLAKAQAEAGMAVDVARGAYGTAVDTIGSKLAANQALASGITSTGQALGGGISGYGAALGAAKAAGTGSTALTSQGFYRDEIGAANVMGVAPKQLSYQKPTGGFLGFGGKEGGFYYNPSGQYGRENIPKSAFGAMFGAFGS